MVRVIGNADEFWRLRITRVDTTQGLDFEWHDDILYREPDVDLGDEVEYLACRGGADRRRRDRRSTRDVCDRR